MNTTIEKTCETTGAGKVLLGFLVGCAAIFGLWISSSMLSAFFASL